MKKREDILKNKWHTVASQIRRMKRRHSFYTYKRRKVISSINTLLPYQNNKSHHYTLHIITSLIITLFHTLLICMWHKSLHNNISTDHAIITNHRIFLRFPMIIMQLKELFYILVKTKINPSKLFPSPNLPSEILSFSLCGNCWDINPNFTYKDEARVA